MGFSNNCYRWHDDVGLNRENRTQLQYPKPTICATNDDQAERSEGGTTNGAATVLKRMMMIVEIVEA
ncbi:hypothetical protein V6N12_049224 [Hibiscus sabdariffa]|uniref:Uncharacterized protein n=1 Tax=Hibiscus sabdariffa TaxID=183260 RepID=A0ABR2EJY4_9ROSI